MAGSHEQHKHREQQVEFSSPSCLVPLRLESKVTIRKVAAAPAIAPKNTNENIKLREDSPEDGFCGCPEGDDRFWYCVMVYYFSIPSIDGVHLLRSQLDG